MILYTRFLPVTDAITLTPRLIIIKSAYRDDLPLLFHEQCHQQQMRLLGTATFWWCYLTSSEFRQTSEVEAYKVQIADGASPTACAINLATRYRLSLTLADAYKLLTTT